MTKNLDFIDDLTTANARLSEQETRLGLPKSEARIDILEANTVLRGLELVPTPARPPVPAAQSGTSPAPATTTATGRQRVAQAYASNQPTARHSAAAPGFPKDGKLHGVTLLAAFYAKRTSSSAPTA